MAKAKQKVAALLPKGKKGVKKGKLVPVVVVAPEGLVPEVVRVLRRKLKFKRWLRK